MTSPQPLITADDLAVYLNDDSIDQSRAEAMIADAQNLCETVVTPLPPAAASVIKRMAGRAYVSVLSTRQVEMQAGGSPYGGVEGGAVRLYREDKADLLRAAGKGGAFSVDMLPPDYVAPGFGFEWPDWDRIA